MSNAFLKLEPIKGAAEYYAGTREDNKPCVWMKDTEGHCSIIQNAKSLGDAQEKALKWQVKENYAVLKSQKKVIRKGKV